MKAGEEVNEAQANSTSARLLDANLSQLVQCFTRQNVMLAEMAAQLDSVSGSVKEIVAVSDAMSHDAQSTRERVEDCLTSAANAAQTPR